MSENKEEKILRELKELREVIFNMLNFTNMYCLVLDNKLVIKFVNLSLAIDLGFKCYTDLINKCWLDFIDKKEITMINTVHSAIANGIENWEEKYREVQNKIITKEGKFISVHWFNSHINTDLNWTFSFGIKREPIIDSVDSIRDFYYDVIQKDRVMINSMRDAMGLRDKIIDSCRPSFIENENSENRISVG